jgi:GNAT superfamily N-acetyltransferase
MKLRSATPEDHAALVQLQRSASLTAYTHIFPPDHFPFPLVETEEHWRRVLSATDEEVIVVVEAGLIMGVVAVRGAELHSLFVDPDHWGSGTGSSLVGAALRGMRERGERHAKLWVMRENQAARRFYERMGWTPDGRVESSSFPPHPPLTGYEFDLSTLEETQTSW